MTMKRRKISACLLAVILSISMIFPGGVPGGIPETAQAMTVLETTVSEASEGCSLFGIYGAYYTEAQNALDRINAIRKEACEAGNIMDPRDPSRMLTPDDYVPLKWSSDLENIARIRASEASIGYAFMDSGHERLNEKDTFTVTSNGVSSSAEDLAYYYVRNMIEGITLWYMEKQYWLDWPNITQETGHYTSIINPDYRYIGLGLFTSEAGRYPNVLAGELSRRENLDETMQTAPEDVMQKIEIADRYIDHYFLEGKDTVDTDKSITLVPKVQIRRNNAVRDLWLLGSITWKSSDPSVASVDASGNVTGHKKGTVTITAEAKEYNKTITQEVTVKCTHAKTRTSYTRPTCMSTGKKVYYCSICNDTTEEVLPKAAHDYVYGEADSDGKRQGVCKNCGDSIRIVPPTSLHVQWGKKGASNWQYTDSFPTSSAGDEVNCYPQVADGDSDYKDVIVETTDASVVSAPENVYPNGPLNPLTIEGNGIATISVYLKYNPSVRKDVVVRVGAKGSISLADTSITFDKTTYTYDGNKCTPKVTVAYNDSKLVKNVDYTVAYEKNTYAGTAVAVITGKGILSGTVRKEFTIQPASSAGHTHQAVKDVEIAATCTEPGLSEGSHCSICGQVIEEAKVIPAAGHKYVDGTCTVCGDFTYIDRDGLRYTRMEDKDSENGVFSVSAAPGQKLSGEIRIPSRIKVNDLYYAVVTVADNAFSGQSGMIAVSLPKTITEIGSNAFDSCSALQDITMYSVNAPEVKSGAFTGISASAVLHCQSSSRGYNTMTEGTTLTVKRDASVEHDLEFVPAVDPTCEEPGNVAYYYCKDCGGYFLNEDATGQVYQVDTLIYALGHDWDSDFTIDIPATATTDGERSIHCKRCDARRMIDVIPAGGSDEDDNNGDDSGDGNANGNNGNADSGNGNNSGNSGSSTTTSVVTIFSKGSAFRHKGIFYRVLTAAGKKKTASLAVSGIKNNKVKTVSVPASFTYHGVRYHVTSIRKYAFSGYRKLTQVTIPSSVKKIAARSFFAASKLKKITIKSSLLTKKNVSSQAFAGLSNKTIVKVPAKKKAAYKKFIKKVKVR